MTKQLQTDASEYTTIVRREEATNGTYCYVAFHPELPNSVSQGDTPEEVEENLIEATELTLTYLKANNLPIPEPVSWQDRFFSFVIEGETSPRTKLAEVTQYG